MKKINIIKVMTVGLLSVGLASCKNSDIEFPDYEGGISVYFPYQTPVRHMMLGTDDLGSTADNDTRTCKISATMGGAYEGKQIKVQAKIDKDLVKNLYFDQDCTKPVEVLPDDYYNYSEIANATLDFKGGMKGSVDVKLTDKFFADPKCIGVNYVIPMVMTSTSKGEIIAGNLFPGLTEGNRFDGGAWTKLPMDYVLYCIRYLSKFEGYYLPMGTFKTTYGTETSSTEIKYSDWEKVQSNEVLYLKTNGENQVTYQLTAAAGSDTYTATVAIDFNGNNGTISVLGKGKKNGAEIDATITGSATYTDSSSAYKWGGKDRAGLKLTINADWNGEAKTVVDYDMALQRRGAGNFAEEFSVTLKK